MGADLDREGRQISRHHADLLGNHTSLEKCRHPLRYRPHLGLKTGSAEQLELRRLRRRSAYRCGRDEVFEAFQEALREGIARIRSAGLRRIVGLIDQDPGPAVADQRGDQLELDARHVRVAVDQNAAGGKRAPGIPFQSLARPA